MSEKKLMVYPIVSLVCSGIVLVSFLVPFYFFVLPIGNEYVTIAFLFLVYVILTFVGILFNASIVAYSSEKFRGKDPNFGNGLKIAASKWTKLLGWAVLSATVGLIIRIARRFLRKKLGLLGSFIGSLLGMAWTYATFFILPVLLLEKEGIFSSVKNSALLFKDTWGETIAGNIGFGLIFILLGLLGILPFFAALMVGVPLLIVLILLVIYLLVIFALYTAMKSVFVAALYRFAREGILPGPYRSDMIPDPQGSPSAGGTGSWSSESSGSTESGGSGYAPQSGQSSMSLDDMEGVEVMEPGQSSAQKDQNSRGFSSSPEDRSRTCPDCGEELRYMEESGRWYCDNCYQYK
ncbi:MAG: DUF6159 family protein [Candidatus Thermoplasmatota archaeon]